ncbi:hypothetical protein AJ85_04655 [Alkalihalobacillus alcalophilus ATCC 27647 = CGMCC 1.3604]|uniref:Uncharacterized protein n=1 Tax=Alkalihalobacillus alcalophilus ATCC 27647 = CGMCC 1.3604 TaxID=1218173 RepID=A0A094YVV0_ALKAL|nr:hypothetical protein [Alkalihalobacillus alcalophilus]KGA97652.1 hypothetical protein BALCAV_0208920 [Alkalihalobacillus alcalophilus ATCC 27647 = CGMCC 1.3604]MED1561313.1 hypothetical protein [Alkalihalobacillus alcalophilus]THG91476.1 hypothetical protein AJ85_04655 [Alkalihalobacillus alcalophilus ATCC 27647 = CGMCC 1.3604]
MEMMSLVISSYLFIIVLFVGCFYLGKKIIKPKSQLKYHPSLILLTVYSVLLLLAPIIFSLLPKDELKPVQLDLGYTYTKQEAAESVARVEEAERLIEAGNFTDIDQSWISDTWSFDYEDDEIYFTTMFYQSTFPIYIERKEENDGMIEAFMIARTELETALGYVLEERRQTARVELGENRLLVMGEDDFIRKPVRLFDHGFPIKQFQGAYEADQVNPSTGQSMIYLKIPHDLEIITDDDSYYKEINK